MSVRGAAAAEHDIDASAASPRAAAATPRAVAATAAAVASAALLLAPVAAHALPGGPLADAGVLLAGGDPAAAVADAFAPAFAQAFSLTFLSELGDKTFFIAGLLAVKFSRAVSFVGSLGALAVMTVISVLIGQVFHAVPSSIANGIPLDDYFAAALFLYFGVQTLRDAAALPDELADDENDELIDAQEEVAGIGGAELTDPGSWSNLGQTFSLIFAAEFGDKSFISTIGLGAAQNPIGVTLGAILAHGSATGIAVIGGTIVSKYLSEKVIGYIGGSLFLVFAASTLVGVVFRG